jgi:cellulose biosynthesis protein BcsQ
VAIKAGFFGGQGAGKTTSAAMLGLALAKELHGSAPVWVTAWRERTLLV